MNRNNNKNQEHQEPIDRDKGEGGVVSLFHGFNRVVGQLPISQIIEGIRGSDYEEQVVQIRSALNQGQEEHAQELKKRLPAFTPSGQFSGGRRLEFLTQYNALIVLDLDNLGVDLGRCQQCIIQEPYTRACFMSPSGQGLKILVAFNGMQSDHQQAFTQIADYYESLLAIKVDRSGKDITRLCFMSHDPGVYYEPDSKVFDLQKDSNNMEKEYTRRFDNCVGFTNKKQNYISGNRNNFIYLLASNCNRAGIPQAVALEKIKVDYDLPLQEIQKTVASAYKHHQSEFNTLGIDHPPTEILEQMPSCLPTSIFSQLPDLLREASLSFEDHRERDVFLTGALTVLSAAIPKINGTYDRKTSYPNLFSFIVAPAASGKGALSFSKELGMAYHRNLVKASKAEQKQFLRDWQRYELSVSQYKRGKISDLPEAPEEQAFRLFYIPANSSSAMLIRHLQQNGGKGMLFESEADTLGNVLKQDWGGYSDLLRKAFHHEPIAYSRKLNKEFVEIDAPRLSVAISGTPGQVIRLIPSVEDGLFSRFLFYVFEVDPVWRDVSPRQWTGGIKALYDKLAKEVESMISFLESHPTRFELSSQQWDTLNAFFSEQLQRVEERYGREALSIIKRLGVICFRLAMILTACRKYEDRNTTERLVCLDQEFEVAKKLVEVYMEHALYLYERLPQQESGALSKVSTSKESFYQALPERFRRKEAIGVGKDLRLSAATVDRFLKQLLGTLLEQPEYGVYKKC